MDQIYDNPRNVFQAKVNAILTKEPIISDLFENIFKLQQVLSLEKINAGVQKEDPDQWKVLLELFTTFGSLQFSKIISITQGKTITFPSQEEFQDSIITVLCYYYKEEENMTWDQIKEKLNLPKLNTIKFGIRVRQLKGFIDSKIMRGYQMDDQDVKIAREALVISQGTERFEAIPYSPTQEVEKSLIALLQNRIEKVQTDNEFEENIKSAILARLPEASFGELMGMLNIVQHNSNDTTEKILSPFIPKAGERVPILDSDRSKAKRAIEQKAIDEMPREVAEGITKLSKFMKFVEKQMDKKEKAENSQP